MRPKLSQIDIFCLTHERGSFTAAARALGISPQAASRAVSRLEDALGVELFRRNTRHVEITDAGQLYYDACRGVLDALEDAEARLARRRDSLQGQVRISVPTTYGHHRFLPTLPDFLARHPGIVVDVEVSNRNVDFVREGFDLAVRMGALDDASFIARPLGHFSLGVFASPDYLARRGTPCALDDLDAHTCAVFIMPRTGRTLRWAFGAAPTFFSPTAAVQIRDDVLGLITFARAGGGLIQIYHFLVERELREGLLLEVMPDLAEYARPFSLIYPRASTRRPEVRALIDFVLERSGRDA